MTGPATPVTIRPEAAGDEPAIHRLTEAAFKNMAFSEGKEPRIVDRLRRDGDLALSLVAEDADRIVGHIAFSPVSIVGGTKEWFGLGPVSVWPELQRSGIGSALIRRGIADLSQRGARGIVLLGDPHYYGRFGFEHVPELTYPGPPPQYFQALLLDGDMPSGEVTYPLAFEEN